MKESLRVHINPRQIRRRKIISALFTFGIFAFALASITPLFMIFFTIFQKGFSVIEPSFFTNVPAPLGESGGGILNALIGTALLVTIASVISLPLGIFGGLYLAEKQHSKMGEMVRLSMEVLQGIPSIVIGLVAYILFVAPFGMFSALAGGIALGIMMLPIIVRNTEETLKMLPTSLKEASYALGAPYYHTMMQVLLPAAINGIVTGALVSVARVAGETAPLLFTSFGNQFMSYSPFEPIAALPHIIFTYATGPYVESHALAWGASIVLILFILGLNLFSKLAIAKLGITKK